MAAFAGARMWVDWPAGDDTLVSGFEDSPAGTLDEFQIGGVSGKDFSNRLIGWCDLGFKWEGYE